MRKIIGFGLLAGLALLTPALANSSEDKTLVAAPPKPVAGNLEQMGYDLQSVRKRDDRYHANLLDRDTGTLIHAEFRMTDGELISARLLAKDKERRHHTRERSDSHRGKGHHGGAALIDLIGLGD